MSFDRPGKNIQEGTYPPDKIEAFREIKTPEDLLAFMRANIRYGFVGKKDRQIYSPEFAGWGQGESPEQELQAPAELLSSGYGTCWEQTELERNWFRENNFDFKTFLLLFGPEISQKNPAHSFLVFKKDNKWCWFENTLDIHNGLHEFASLEDLIENVKTIVISNAIKNGATEDDIRQFKLIEYDVPAHGLSQQDFIAQVTEGKSG